MLSEKVIRVLNELSGDINREYGFERDFPRINLGPCAPFAKMFYMVWNQLFPDHATICFLFPEKRDYCVHCFIKLPGGDYFDGGNGVVLASEAEAIIPPGCTIEEMKEYD